MEGEGEGRARDGGQEERGGKVFAGTLGIALRSLSVLPLSLLLLSSSPLSSSVFLVILSRNNFFYLP